jgi:hypothetical protein
MIKQMSIQEVLSEMSDTSSMGGTFTLRFVRSSGQRKGTIATVAKCRYGAPRRQRDNDAQPGPSSANSNRSGRKWLHTEAGTIPCTDTERNRYFTPLISHIIQYNDYQVLH